MTKVCAILFIMVALAACDSPEPPYNASEPQPYLVAPGPNPVRIPLAAPTVALPAPADLVGEWRVAGIDGESLKGDIGIALSIDAATLSFEPRCAGFVWDYSYARGEVELKRAPSINRPVGGAPAPVCAVAVSSEQIALGKALDTVRRAGRTPENGLLLSGGRHSVTLFSQ